MRRLALLDHEMVKFWEHTERVMDDPKCTAVSFITRLFFCAPLRLNEMRHVKLDDINLEAGVIFVRAGKGGTTRYVEIVPEFIPYIEYYIKLYTRPGQTWLFPALRRSPKTRRGKVTNSPISRRQIEKWWTSVLRLAGVRHVNLHTTRRAHVYWFRDRLTAMDMKDQLGHSSLRTTETYYWESVPGRRFNKAKPEWVKLMEAGAERLKTRLVRGGLRILNGGVK